MTVSRIEDARRTPAVRIESRVVHGYRRAFRIGRQRPPLLLIHGIGDSSATWRTRHPRPRPQAHRHRARPPGPRRLRQAARRLLRGRLRQRHARPARRPRHRPGDPGRSLARRRRRHAVRLPVPRADRTAGPGSARAAPAARCPRCCARRRCPAPIWRCPPCGCPAPARSVGLVGADRAPGHRPRRRTPPTCSASSTPCPTPPRAPPSSARCARSSTGAGRSSPCSTAATSRRACRRMLMWGTATASCPSGTRTAHAAMPGSRLEIFEGAGHFPFHSDPRRFVPWSRSSSGPPRRPTGAGTTGAHSCARASSGRRVQRIAGLTSPTARRERTIRDLAQPGLAKKVATTGSWSSSRPSQAGESAPVQARCRGPASASSSRAPRSTKIGTKSRILLPSKWSYRPRTRSVIVSGDSSGNCMVNRSTTRLIATCSLLARSSTRRSAWLIRPWSPPRPGRSNPVARIGEIEQIRQLVRYTT